jgi:hypothetical protein
VIASSLGAGYEQTEYAVVNDDEEDDESDDDVELIRESPAAAAERDYPTIPLFRFFCV